MLQGNGFQNPTDPMHAAFQIVHKHEGHAFQWYSAKPERLSQFQNHMSGYSLSREKWMGIGCVPLDEVLGKDVEPNEVLLVDVGGGTGHDIVEFYDRYTDPPGRLVLQDLPDVIASVKDIPKAVEPMVHDFFTEQPIKGKYLLPLHALKCITDGYQAQKHTT